MAGPERRAPHRRFDPLRRTWILVSPDRTTRPWLGQIEPAAADAAPSYDSACYLCPGNLRANGERNPPYASTFAFDNDFAALVPDEAGLDGIVEAGKRGGHPIADSAAGLLAAESERGVCRVVCFSPRHDLTLPLMETAAIRAVVDRWVAECAALAGVPWTAYATVFENRGAMMGASNPHPHGQIWATEHVPDEPAREHESLAAHRTVHGSCLLCDYAALESGLGTRVVCANEWFVAVVPFWAAWPFETLVIARDHLTSLQDLDGAGRDALADLLRRLTTRYDNLFESPFPYSIGFHQELKRGTLPHSHLHAHVYPPLLRSATVRKFMVGFELLGSPQRDLTPEEAAARLQSVAETHYTLAGKAGAAR